MLIGLYSDNMPSFPSLPLMKLSAYHKAKGDSVELITNWFQHYDIAYVSRVFNLTGNKKTSGFAYTPLAGIVHYGGSGYAIKCANGRELYNPSLDKPLPAEIEHIMPDYALYPALTKNTAYGFLTRGCPRNCPFCIVAQKEGRKSIKVADINEFWYGKREIKLMDANILACPQVGELIGQLADSGAMVDFTQGLDARLVDDAMAKALSKVRTRMVHFAMDNMRDMDAVRKGLEAFRAHTSLTFREMRVYMLTNFDTSPAEDWERVKLIQSLGFAPDVRIYQKGTQPQFLTDLARWANNKMLQVSCRFEDYVPRRDGKKCGELYKNILRGD